MHLGALGKAVGDRRVNRRLHTSLMHLTSPETIKIEEGRITIDRLTIN